MTTPIYGFPQIEIGQLQRGKDQKFNAFALAVENVIAGLSAVYQPLDADLTAISALSGTGIAVRTAVDTWTTRTLVAPAAGMTIANPAGVAGNMTFALANDLAALEALASTGFAVRSAADTWVQRTITGTAEEVTVTNGNGVSGNPTISLPATINMTGKVFKDTAGVFDFRGSTTGTTNICGASFQESDGTLSCFVGEASTGNRDLHFISYLADMRFRVNGAASDDFTMTETAFSPFPGSAKALGGSSSRWTVGYVEGVNFPATQVASADANTLDDYEEGTWTPTLTFVTPGNLNVVYSIRAASYTKVGRSIEYIVNLRTSTFTHTTASGAMNISGVPFTAAALSVGTSDWRGITLATHTDFCLRMNFNATVFEGLLSGSAVVPTTVTTAHMPTGGTVEFFGQLTQIG